MRLEDQPYDGLERSNTTNSFKSFFFGTRPTKDSAAPARRPSRKGRRTTRPKTTDTAIDPHFPTLPYLRPDVPRPAPLRQSKLVLVDKLERDDRITAWQEQRLEEIGGLEKWRAQVAKEVAWEKAIMEDGRVGAAVEELEGMLDVSAFSTSFTVDSLQLPPSPDVPPTPPPKDPLPAPPAAFLELDEDEDGRPQGDTRGMNCTTLVLDTTIELPPPPLAPKMFTPLASAAPLPMWSVPRAAPLPHRFPLPPSPTYPNLVRVETSLNTPPPISVFTPSTEPGQWTGSPPPRTTSLPFGDLLQVSAPPPPECAFVPPKAAALLGLLGSTIAGRNPAGVAITQEASRPSAIRPPLRRFDSSDIEDRKCSIETSSVSVQTGASLFSARATTPHISRPSFSSSSAPTSATASIDLKHPLFPPRSSTFTNVVKSSFAQKRKQAPPGLFSLKLRKEGMSSLPDLHSAGLTAAQHESIHPAPPQPWVNWRTDNDDDERESLIDGFDFACTGNGLSGDRIASTRATRSHSESGPAADVQLRVATVIRKVSVRSLRGGRMLVRALSKSGGNMRKTPPGRVVVEDEQEEQRWTDLRKEWAAERDDLEGLLSRRCCI